jgi:outer membrane protein assembly factor BamE (lipoprotein component of BamABCDE complex)
MKNIVIALGIMVLAGCASAPGKKYAGVLEGMSRNNLRYYFGEPLRTEPAAGGGENWYYRFSSWNAQPASASGTTIDAAGQRTDYATAGLSFSKNTVELPVHLSADGFVVRPVPDGKVLKN